MYYQHVVVGYCETSRKQLIKIHNYQISKSLSLKLENSLNLFLEMSIIVLVSNFTIQCNIFINLVYKKWQTNWEFSLTELENLSTKSLTQKIQKSKEKQNCRGHHKTIGLKLKKMRHLFNMKEIEAVLRINLMLNF